MFFDVRCFFVYVYFFRLVFTKASEASWSYSCDSKACDSKVSFDRVQILTPDFSGRRPPPPSPPPPPLSPPPLSPHPPLFSSLSSSHLPSLPPPLLSYDLNPDEHFAQALARGRDLLPTELPAVLDLDLAFAADCHTHYRGPSSLFASSTPSCRRSLACG